MPLDAKWIETQIKLESEKLKRLERLRQIASDPEMVSLLREAFSAEEIDDSSEPAPAERQKAAQDEAPKETQAQLIVDSLVGSTTSKVKRGTLTDSVRLKAESIPTAFTGYELTELMQREGYVFTAKDPPISVIDILRKLVRRGILNKAQKGSGSQPDYYIRKSSLFVEKEGPRIAA